MIKLESKRTNLVSSNIRDAFARREIENTIRSGIKGQIPSPIKPMHFAPFYGHLFSADIHVSKLFSSSQNPNV